LSAKATYKKYTVITVFFYLLICFLLLSECSFQVQAKVKSKSKRRSHIVKQHRPSKEEEAAARENAAREATEAKLIEGKNVILARAYKLYDSGTSESLLGNYKYSILQLKLADELLTEHGQNNSSLAIVTLMALASSAESAKDYPLARSAYERLLSIRPTDTQILLSSAKLETSQSNFTAAQNYVNRLLEINPSNAEGRILADFVVTKLQPAKR